MTKIYVIFKSTLTPLVSKSNPKPYQIYSAHLLTKLISSVALMQVMSLCGVDLKAWSTLHVNPVQRASNPHRPTERCNLFTFKLNCVLFVNKFFIIFFYFFQNWEVMNTAVLTGRQVSQAMKVFIVSQAGKAADVTLQSSCHSEDESVLKVI